MRTPQGSATRLALPFLTLTLTLSTMACGSQVDAQAEPLASSSAVEAATEPHMTAPTPVEAGRYLVMIGGCHDCHTEGFMVDPAAVPESEWLKGSAMGFRGPWGTSFPRNLRLTVQNLTEDEWVARLQHGEGLPPMPWFGVNHLADGDARAMYAFIRSLGEPGAPAPTALPPGVEPETLWLDFEPKVPAQLQAGGR